jgi:hypothetical protein
MRGPAPRWLAFSHHDLALRELEAAARLGAAILLAFDHAAVAGEEAGGLDRRAQRGLVLAQRLGDAVLDRAGLARKAAALDRGDDIVLAFAPATLNGWLMTRRSVGRAK